MLFLSFFIYSVCFYILDSSNLDNSNFKFWEPALWDCFPDLMLIKSIYLYICNNDVMFFVNPPSWQKKNFTNIIKQSEITSMN